VGLWDSLSTTLRGNFLYTRKGLRQGDPLSHILFNLLVDILSRMLQKANRNMLIEGLGKDLIDRGVISLQYADDTLLFMGGGGSRLETSSAYYHALNLCLVCKSTTIRVNSFQ
jgi:hypothetical protein